MDVTFLKSFFITISIGCTLVSGQGQENGPTTEIVTFPLPGVPLAPPGRSPPADLDVFANDVPFGGDQPSELDQNQLMPKPSNQIGSQNNDISLETLPTTAMAVDIGQEVTLPTATEVIQTTTENVPSIQTPTESVVTDLNTVASNFDPSFLQVSGNETNDLIIISDNTTPDTSLNDPNLTTFNDPNAQPAKPKVQPVVKDASLLVPETTGIRSDTVATTAITDSPSPPDLQQQMTELISTANKSMPDVLSSGSTPLADITLTQPSVTEPVVSYGTTVLTPSETIGTTQITKTVFGPTVGGISENITIVNESNLDQYLITKPKISTSVDPITVDQSNINQYLTTKQRGTTPRPSVDSSLESFGPPPPPPYSIIQDGNANNIPSQDQLNTAFQPRAKQLFPGRQIPVDEQALIMQFRNRNTKNRDFARVNIPEERRILSTTTTTQEPTPMAVAYDPDFDVNRALPPPPDPNATDPPPTTPKLSTQVVVVGSNNVDIPPPPLSGDGVPPPPLALFREPNELDYITTTTTTTSTTTVTVPKPLPSIPVPSVLEAGARSDKYRVSSSLDKLAKGTTFTKFGQRRPNEIYSTDVQSLFEKDKKFIVDFNSLNFRLPSEFFDARNQIPGLPMITDKDSYPGGNEQVSAQKPTSGDRGLDPTSNNLSFNEKVDQGRPPPIFIDESVEKRPVPPSIRPPNEVLTQKRVSPPIVRPKRPDQGSVQPYRTFGRTRVYFGNENNALSNNPSFEKAFQDKIVRWGNAVREDLREAQMGRTENPPTPSDWRTTTSSPQMFRIQTRQRTASIGRPLNADNQVSNTLTRNSQSQFADRSTANRRIFNYWKDSSSDRDTVRVVPNIQRPPPIVITPPSGSSQDTRPRAIQPQGDIPTFLNSGMARRDTTRTASTGTPQFIYSNQNPSPRPDNSLTLFQLPDADKDLIKMPDIRLGPAYTSPLQSDIPPVVNVVNPVIRNIKSGPNVGASPQPIYVEPQTTERTTTLRTPVPITTTDTFPTTTTTTITTTTPTTTTVTQWRTTPTTFTVPSTQLTIASNKQSLDTVQHSNINYETIESSPAGLLGEGYSPTPIMVISEEKINVPVIEMTPSPILPTESTTVTRLSDQNMLKSTLTVGLNVGTLPTSTETVILRNPRVDNVPGSTDLLVEEKSPLRPPPILVETVPTERPTTTAKYVPVTRAKFVPNPPVTPAFRKKFPTTTPVPLSTAEQLTQEEIIKRLQMDSVLKAELPPEICHQCHYVNNVCFMSEAAICNRFVECVQLGGNVRAFEKECSLGNFWSPKSLACEKSYTVDCPADPCKDSRLERHPYNGRCRAYWSCINGTSVIKCCPNNYRYSGIDKICIPDHTCSEPCDAPRDIVKEPPKKCPWKSVPGKLLLFTDGYSTQSCAPGTRFDVIQCTCVKSNIIPEGEACKPDMLVDFEGGKNSAFRDKSGRMHGVGEENVVLRSGTGLFFGTGKLSFWRYANVELGPLLAFKIRFFPYGRSTKSMGLLSNCNGTPIGSTVDIRLNTWTNEITFKLSTNVKLHNRITLTYQPFTWNEAIFIYDGSSFSVASNKQTGQLFLEGSIPQQHPAIQVGGCNYKDGYRGYVDDVYIYNGCIPDDLDWVIFAR